MLVVQDVVQPTLRRGVSALGADCADALSHDGTDWDAMTDEKEGEARRRHAYSATEFLSGQPCLFEPPHDAS